MQELGLALRLERRIARQKLEEHDAECIEIAPAVDCASPRLLRRHVRDLALYDAARGLRAPTDGVCDAEVGDLHGTVEPEQDVLGVRSRWTRQSGVPSGAVPAWAAARPSAMRAPT